MDDKRTPNARVKYTGRFANAADSAPPRVSVPARPRAASANAQANHRPTGFAAAPQNRRAPANPAPAKDTKPPKKPKREKPINNKRGAARNSGFQWKTALLIAIPILVVLIIVLILAAGSRGEKETYHQLPRVERGTSSAFTPEEKDPAESPDDGESLFAGEPEAET